MGKKRTNKRKQEQTNVILNSTRKLEDSFTHQSINGNSTRMNSSHDSRDANHAMTIFTREYRKAMTLFTRMALSRFKYITESGEELPDGFMPEELEMRLLRYGNAVAFMWLDKMWTLQCISTAPLDPYGYGTKLRAIGIDFERDVTNSGVRIFDSTDKYKLTGPIYDELSYVAEKIASIEVSRDLNRRQLQRPIILDVPTEMVDEVTEMFNAAGSPQKPYIVKHSSPAGELDLKVNDIDMKVQNHLEDFRKEKASLYNEGLSLLGINFKDDVDKSGSGTMSRGEISTNSEETEFIRLSFLEARRNGIEEFNEKYGTDIEVVWNKDIVSGNYNLIKSIQEQADNGLAGQGVTTGSVAEAAKAASEMEVDLDV